MIFLYLGEQFPFIGWRWPALEWPIIVFVWPGSLSCRSDIERFFSIDWRIFLALLLQRNDGRI
jgi:hypothetical protein